MKLKQCLIVISTFWPTIAVAASDTFVTGNHLLDECSKRSEFCTGYIAGLTDEMLVFDVVNKQRIACLPDKVLLGQLEDIAMNYLRAHPEGRHHNAGSIITFALMKAFPCNK